MDTHTLDSALVYRPLKWLATTINQ